MGFFKTQKGASFTDYKIFSVSYDTRWKSA